MDEKELSTAETEVGSEPAKKEDAGVDSTVNAAGEKTPEQPEEITPDGEEPRDPEAEDDGEDEGPGAPVDETPQVHTLTVSTSPTHTTLTARWFHEAEGWVVRSITLGERATAKMLAEAIADIRSW